VEDVGDWELEEGVEGGRVHARRVPGWVLAREAWCKLRREEVRERRREEGRRPARALLLPCIQPCLQP